MDQSDSSAKILQRLLYELTSNNYSPTLGESNILKEQLKTLNFDPNAALAEVQKFVQFIAFPDSELMFLDCHT
jgi:hypothetical protein